MTIKAVLRAVPLLLVGWLLTLASVAALTDEAPAYVVVLPSERFLAALPDGVAIVAASGMSVTLAAEGEGVARRLYGVGARLVLPAGLRGCLPLSPEARRKIAAG